MTEEEEKKMTDMDQYESEGESSYEEGESYYDEEVEAEQQKEAELVPTNNPEIEKSAVDGEENI